MKELNIDIENFVNTELKKHVGERSNYRSYEKIIEDIKEDENERSIIIIIKRIIRESKFDYASRDNIIAEGETQGIRKADIEEILDGLLQAKVIIERPKMNYKLARKGQ